eukprot:1281199-Pyramimonas_sp.AAC.1
MQPRMWAAAKDAVRGGADLPLGAGTSPPGAGSSSLGRIGSRAWMGIHRRETHPFVRTSWRTPPGPCCPRP